MKILPASVAASLVFAAGAAVPAIAATESHAEIGYTRGTLAVADLADGRLAEAERVLTAQSAVDARDPARMINMGIVYARSGRLVEAHRTFIAVGSAPVENLLLSDGREVSSHIVAQDQLALLNRRAVALR
jgi:hypothetical protein